MELTIFLTWIACLLSYSASPNQKLLAKPTNKHAAWGGFLILVIVAYISASQHHIAATAFFYVLALIMACWGAVIFIYGHIAYRMFPVAITAIMLITVLFSTGRQYVA